MKTCLVVDEAPVIRKVASRVLLRAGLAVESVSTCEEALDWVRTNGLPDILIAAACLGDNSGPDFVRAMRELPGGKAVVVLAAIVEANLGLMTRLRRAGVTGYIYKPFDGETLEGWIAPYLQGGASVAA